MISIRNAESSDADSVFNLVNDLESGELKADLFYPAFLSNISNEDIFYFVAEEDNTVIGFISLHIQMLLHHTGKAAEIQELIVSSNFRDHGVGKLLFEKVKETAIQNGCVLLEVCCNQKRLSSHQFYQKQQMRNTHYKFTLNLL